MVEVVVLGMLAVAAASLNGAFAGRPAEPFQEAARLLTLQRRRTARADVLLTRIGVVSLPLAAALAALVVPFGDRAAVGSGVGVVWFNAMEVVAWGAVWLAGWGVNSAFGLVGGYRFLAQGLAYELPHMFALITAALAAHSLDLRIIGEAQGGLWFAVWMPAAFAVYLVSALAMAFWGPFGHPVGGDAAGGVLAELSGPDRLVFLAGRYGLLTVAAAVAVPLFLGGGAGPWLPAWLWSPVKTCAVLALLVWTRRRFPVLRMDRAMTVAWTVLIPATVLQMLVVAIVVV
ncbi:NADH-quinone oxidoreductase subunit H [Actinomadura darangshiensis]|uniref:NADH-quinone oxidoreductase subunit H n=1 Tax=Actinomadura darangshiensis TaxID=705336 RepID=A0A4R5C099_9ACTN|nr:complex I subunit 1 family protein [Actinomadura darangshiensis]TDD91413.1 NADH-quinone oxidoreductase subunit H [Actinomadura darangshiensis]